MGKRVVIIGSGPAGLSAAAALREKGITPLILERRDLLSQKLLASGGTRCNFTNILPMEKFMASFGRNGAFMRNALQFSFREWLLEFLEKNGVKALLSDDFFYFPASGKASDVQKAFLHSARPEIRTGCEVAEILKDPVEDRVRGVLLSSGEEISCDAVILAGGSCAWKGLGTGKGLSLAEKLAHTIKKTLPAMAPLIIQEEWVKSLAGVTLPKGGLSLKTRHGTLEKKGSILFTHHGLSGFPALDLSGEVSGICDTKGEAEIFLTFRTDMDPAHWEKILAEGRQKEGTLLVKTLLGRYLVKSLSAILCGLSDCADTPLCRLNGESRNKLLQILSKCPLTAIGSGPMECAMAMRGGVSLKEVNPATMESRLVKGVYFAGEILDLDGPCGGYNIQWAISSGRLAGSRCAESFFPEMDQKCSST